MKERLEDYALLALEQARIAADSGTFGVGGILINLEGSVICAMHNRVVEGSRVNDPTAHGERQIVDWYFAHKQSEQLPEPENCVLITTLDPCVMCTGALAQVGFNRVIVIALDDYAGINWDGVGDCAALAATDTQRYVKEHFAYPEVTGPLARKAFGAQLSDLALFSDVTISSETLQACLEAFSLTAPDVRNKVSATAVELADVKNPALLEPSHPIRAYLQESFGDDFCACSWGAESSAADFIAYINRRHPGFQGIAYFDHFGNLFHLSEDDERTSTLSAFMQLTRKLAAVRNTEPIEGYEINEYFANPKYGYFVYMGCPEISAQTIMEIGAIGSTLENASVHPIVYILDEDKESALAKLIQQLPPLYNKVIDIRFQQAPLAPCE